MKVVQSGAHYTTVEVDTAEAVKFSFPSTSLSIEAAGGDITVALTDTAQAGDDETITVPDGESRMFIHHRMNVDTYYLTGSGTAKLYASNMGDVNPFKAGKRGGDGGGDNTHYKGTTTTALENGSTTNPIIIVKDDESYTYTAVFGDVVVYGYTEFVFDGTTWSEFGRPFDTVPTLNSTNAVTSDGVYRNTAGGKYFVNNVLKGEVFNNSNNRAVGNHSHAEGDRTTASGHASHAEGQNTVASGDISHAEGYYTAASGTASSAGGFYTIANKPSSTAIGKYNVADTNITHLLIVGNGTADARSNIFEVSETDMNVNGDIQQNGVPLRATTMPTITASMLGKVVQYVGASDNNYKQGWNYVAVSDGEETPTYSWKALMDTTPTSGSTNAVTSDGIATLVRKGTGGGMILGTSPYSTATANYSLAFGNACNAIGNRSIALGDFAVASGPYSTAIGLRVISSQTSQFSVGKYNKTRTGDLFNIGNGINGDNRSNIVEVNHTSANVNGDIEVNKVPIPTPYTTMPTITADMLGKIAMYVGATGNGYTQGCFYVASTDGAAEPTYSWVRIGSTRTETVLWENEGTTNPQTITLSEAYTNFDELIAVTDYIASSKHYIDTHSILVDAIIVGNPIYLWYNDAQEAASYAVTSATLLTFDGALASRHITKIIGIKY